MYTYRRGKPPLSAPERPDPGFPAFAVPDQGNRRAMTSPPVLHG